MQITNSTDAPAANPKKKDDPARIHEAAQQFEAFLISQLMKSMHTSGSSLGSGEDEDQAGSTAIDMAQEQFAKALSSQGGLGLAKMVEAGLKRANVEPAATASYKLTE